VEGHNDHGRLEMSHNSVDEAMRLWDQAWEEEILQYAVKDVRERVKPRTFECFRMVFLEKIPVKKTAEKMGISANLVSQHKHKVMHLIINTAKKIRKILEE
jgi:FixJ family two-component response regulator